MKTQTKERTSESKTQAPGRARQIPVPPEARDLSRLSRIDYEDAFVVDVGPGQREWTSEHWARTMIEGAPDDMRTRLRQGWTLLGLKLGPVDSPDHVLGWELEHSGTDHALLTAGSRVGMPGELLFRPDGDRLLFCTFIQQKNPLAKVAWGRIEAQHQEIVAGLLNRVARSE